jgi:probable F420-dependent oxidoreductase
MQLMGPTATRQGSPWSVLRTLIGQPVAEVRPFRFATASFQTTRSGLLSDANKAQSLGYDVFVTPDHLFQQLAPFAALSMLAERVELRLGTYVLCNDFRHPVVMAKEVATVDVLSGGRLEFGIGGGYVPQEFEMAGIPFDRGGTRFERLTEAVQIAKLAFRGETFSFEGTHYRVRDYTPHPPTSQQPRPPLMLGGGGPRLLKFAAAEADIVSALPASAPGGGLRASQLPLRSLKEKIAVVRSAAGERWKDLEVNTLIFDAVVTTDRRGAASAYLDELTQRLGQFEMDGELTVDDLLDSPYLVFGTADEIAEHLRHVREEAGASYIGVFPHLMDAFEPVLDRLRGV